MNLNAGNKRPAPGDPGRRAKPHRAGIAILAALAALFAGAMLCSCDGDPSIGDVLKKNGYAEVKPPVRFYPPGTWVVISHEHPLYLSVVCTPDEAFGPGVPLALLSSESTNQIIKQTRDRKYSLEADTLDKIKAKAAFADVSKITFNLTNTRFVEIPDSVVMDRCQGMSPSCCAAIKLRLKKDKPVSMIKAVMMADMVYQVEFSRKLEANVEADIRQKLATELKVEMTDSTSGSHLIVGKNLIWGVRDDADLAGGALYVALGPSKSGQPPAGKEQPPGELILKPFSLAQADRKSLLAGKGPVTKIETTVNVRPEVWDKMLHTIKPPAALAPR